MVRRKFSTHKRVDKAAKRKKRTQTIITVTFILLMVVSLAGIYVSQQQNASLSGYQYQGYEFELIQDQASGQSYLQTQVNGQNVPFYSLPQDTFKIKTTGNISAVVQTPQFFMMATHTTPVVDQSIDLLRFDANNYAQKNIVINDAVTCVNATTTVPVIIFIESNTTTQINATSVCLQITSTAQDALLIRDRLLFSMTGIINR